MDRKETRNKVEGFLAWLKPGEYISSEQLKEKLGDETSTNNSEVIRAAGDAVRKDPDLFTDTSGSKIKGFWRRKP